MRRIGRGGGQAIGKETLLFSPLIVPHLPHERARVIRETCPEHVEGSVPK